MVRYTIHEHVFDVRLRGGLEHVVMNEKICKATRRPRAFRGSAMSAALMLCLISTTSLRAECPADLDGSGTVSGSDLGMFLAEWGSPGGPADFNGDGIVDGADMGALLSSWGLCPCEEGIEYTPIHDGTEALEPDVVEYTESAMITRLADRARDRHAREDIVNGQIFRKYDHWLPFYWEQRVADIEIIDRAAMGGDGLTFNFTTLDQLNPAEFRTFYANSPSVAQYHNNMSDYLNQGVTLVSMEPSVKYPGETEYRYTAEVLNRFPDQTPLVVGDRVEVELSQFLLTPRNGRTNYYGTAFLYVVGEGVVPWYAREKEEAATPEEYAAASFDSFKLPEHAWLGGRTTLPYQYSNEPVHRFKQMAGNISHASGHAFTVGRRLHHTDFITGAHSEPDNPVFTEHIGKAGPKFVNTSCVGCHTENGRALPPAVGEVMNRSLVQVAMDATGTPHPILGELIQQDAISAGGGNALLAIEAESYSSMSGVQTEACADEGGGLNVGYIDAGDWMVFGGQSFNIEAAGTFDVEFRVASVPGGGTLLLQDADRQIIHGGVNIAPTGGWQSWITVSMQLSLPAGEHRFAITAQYGGWNLNWFRIVQPGSGSGSEGAVRIASWEEIPGNYGDGSSYSLRRPVYEFSGITPEYHSVRVAPQLIGTGLLEAVDESTLLDLADECDLDEDGISGRVRLVEDPTDPGRQHIGRFGARASTASVRHQIAYALNRDIGVASDLFPILDGETKPTAAEISDEELDLMDRYVSLLGVAARRALTDPVALQGEKLFAQANCTACHTATLVTGSTHPYAELRDQVIHPYTDLLIHDLGEGLADNLGDDDVSGSEWRTAPLWNIGLTAGVSGGEAYLHDGRARTLEEAILWHGGEAEAAREAFRNMTSSERTAVVAFLQSL